jgi:hypothetical protein
MEQLTPRTVHLTALPKPMTFRYVSSEDGKAWHTQAILVAVLDDGTMVPVDRLLKPVEGFLYFSHPDECNVVRNGCRGHVIASAS